MERTDLLDREDLTSAAKSKDPKNDAFLNIQSPEDLIEQLKVNKEHSAVVGKT